MTLHFTKPRPASHDWTCHRCGLTLSCTDIQMLMRILLHNADRHERRPQ